jgi:tRNA(fMet)-specific endonuclease VapC
VKSLFDTDTLSVWQWDTMPDAGVLRLRLDDLADGDIGVSVVTIHEQANGCHAQLNRAKTGRDLVVGYTLFDKLVQSLLKFPVVRFDDAAAAMQGVLQALKTGVKPMDLRIAAIALANNLTLVTRNVSDFTRVPNLKIEDWTR